MGVDLAVIGDRLGHSSYQVTREFYAHIADELQKDAADKINGVLKAAREQAKLPKAAAKRAAEK